MQGMKVSEERVLQINGVRLWTAVQGKGIPMVLCHGGPGGYDYLAPIADMTNVEVGVHNRWVPIMCPHFLNQDTILG